MLASNFSASGKTVITELLAVESAVLKVKIDGDNLASASLKFGVSDVCGGCSEVFSISIVQVLLRFDWMSSTILFEINIDTT